MKEDQIRKPKQLGRPGGGKRKNRDGRKAARRAVAAAHTSRSPQDQLAHLEANGFGHCREAARLRADIAKG